MQHCQNLTSAGLKAGLQDGPPASSSAAAYAWCAPRGFLEVSEVAWLFVSILSSQWMAQFLHQAFKFGIMAFLSDPDQNGIKHLYKPMRLHINAASLQPVWQNVLASFKGFLYFDIGLLQLRPWQNVSTRSRTSTCKPS